jgi:hypothetical protein
MTALVARRTLLRVAVARIHRRQRRLGGGHHRYDSYARIDDLRPLLNARS